MTYTALHIEKMPSGGFVVTDGGYRDPGRYCAPLFACTAIGEALDFIKGQLVPPVASVNTILAAPVPTFADCGIRDVRCMHCPNN